MPSNICPVHRSSCKASTKSFPSSSGGQLICLSRCLEESPWNSTVMSCSRCLLKKASARIRSAQDVAMISPAAKRGDIFTGVTSFAGFAAPTCRMWACPKKRLVVLSCKRSVTVCCAGCMNSALSLRAGEDGTRLSPSKLFAVCCMSTAYSFAICMVRTVLVSTICFTSFKRLESLLRESTENNDRFIALHTSSGTVTIERAVPTMAN
mmetsp:Transcript_49548/g.117964  ORF Transcript_49548/g.117964 Transcript_49548/m.117964 type:complete len:208 (+) Transcript_49548:339-962(+)